MKKKISIKEIATNLNISQTTVSLVLNGKAKEKGISDVLIEKVKRYADQHHYKPNHLAKSLSTGRTMTIGLMVEKVSDYFFAQLVFHLELLAHSAGYQIFFCSSENNSERAKDQIRLFRHLCVDGFIITPPPNIQAQVQELIDEKIPVVLFDRLIDEVETNYVVLNNHESARNAVKHLIQNGYKKIGYVELDSSQSQMRDRRHGYLEAMANASAIPYIERIPFASTRTQIADLVSDFITNHPQLDALLFATNYLAIGGIKALSASGKKVPDHMAIVSFDDHEAFDAYLPRITAVAQPIDELANQLFQVLMHKINHPNDEFLKQVIVPSQLIVRESSRKLSQKGQASSEETSSVTKTKY